jgi:hypothetical protein
MTIEDIRAFCMSLPGTHEKEKATVAAWDEGQR